MKGKIIVIEGTDCSGKETQSNRLKQNLEKIGYKVSTYSFPMYDTPTGKIVGGPFLGKEEICDGYFPEKSSNVEYRVSSLYYAADRLYNIQKINEDLLDGYIVILDRYTYSNMAHQGSKILNEEERIKAYKWIENLEFDLLNLPKADIKLFLYMPLKYSKMLSKNRSSIDQNEMDYDYQKRSSNAFIEVSKLYNFKTIDCIKEDEIKTIDEISLEISDYVLSKLKD